MTSPRTPSRRQLCATLTVGLLSQEELEKKYLQLPLTIRNGFPKDELMDRLNKINWNKPQGRHGPLCLRTKFCSADCVGSDC